MEVGQPLRVIACFHIFEFYIIQQRDSLDCFLANICHVEMNNERDHRQVPFLQPVRF